MSEYCLSCGRDISAINNSVIFECPVCGKSIVRCGTCRNLGSSYTCSCGFKGL